MQVRWTQRAIKHVLTERYYAWQQAEFLAKDDPEIDLSGNGPVYNPMNFEEEAELKGESDFVPESALETETKPGQKTAPTA